MHHSELRGQPDNGMEERKTATHGPSRLLNRNFVLLWQGQFVSRLGDQAFAIALIFWIKEATDSASLMGFYLMVAAIPAILLGPIGGAIADRHSRRNLILLSDVVNGVAVLSLAALMLLRPLETQVILIWLFVVAVIDAVCNSFFDPAINAATPDLVPREKLIRANSFGQMSFQITMFIGQGLGGTLYRLLGAPLLFLIDGLTFLFAALNESFVMIPQRMPEQSASSRDRFAEFRKDLAVGMRYIWRRSGLRGLVVLSALGNFFSVPVVILAPFYVEDFLKVGPDWYGFFLATYGAGTMAGYLFAGVMPLTGKSRVHVMIVAMCFEASTYGLLTQTGPFGAVVLAFVAGFAGGFLMINIATVVQVTTPGEMRGRVLGLIGTLSASITPIASGLVGVVADLMGKNITLIYVSCSAAMLLVSLMAGLNQDIREFLAYEREAEAPQDVEEPAASTN